MDSVVLDGTTGRDERAGSAVAACFVPVHTPGATAVAPLPVLVGVEAAVAHRGWTTARDAVLGYVQTTPCVVVLVGARGGGKTLLLAELARALTAAGTPPVQLRWGDPDAEQALDEGAMPPDRLVLIDEADRIGEEALGRLIGQGRYGLVLARSRDLPASVLEGAATLLRPVTVVPLAPLAPGETAAFLATRLVRAGRPADLIGPEAVARIEAWSGGVPRLVNMLASAALFLATQERGPVTTAHVDQAVEMFSLQAAESARTATDPAGLCSPEDVPVATNALEPGPVVEPSGSSGARDGGIADPPPTTEPLPGVDRQPAPATAVPEPPRPMRRTRRTIPVRRRLTGAERRIRPAAAAAVLLVGTWAAAATWVAAHRPERTEIARAVTASFAAEPVPPAPAAPMQAEAASPSPLLAPSPAPTNVASAAAPEALPAGPNATLALAAPDLDPAPATPIAAPVAVPSPPPERGTRVASAPLPNGPPLAAVPPPPLAAVPQPPRLAGAGPALAAASAPERMASLTRPDRALEPIIRPPASPPRPAQLAARAAAPTRSPQTAAAIPSGRESTVVAFVEPRVVAPPAPHPPAPRSPVQQLVQARRALAANEAPAARELLESAETVIAFQAGVAPERAGMAAAQISDALALLNAGQATSALPHLERAIAVIGPES